MRYSQLAALVCASMLLTGCSPASAVTADALVSNFDIKQVSKVSMEELPELDFSGSEYRLVSGSAGEGKDISSGSSTKYDYSRLVIVGDSRTCGMYTAVTGKGTKDSQIVYSTGNKLEYYVCKVGKGLDWFKGDANSEIVKYANRSSVIVVWLGVNDVGGTKQQAVQTGKSYAKAIKSLKGAVDADVYVLGVTPCTGKYKTLNENIVAFNKCLSSDLGKDVMFLDNYDNVLSKLESGIYKSSDGLHYDSKCYKDIHDYVLAKVGSIGISSGSSGKINPINGIPEDALFFTKFESGAAGYDQTGGDGGNACGKYQFDRRYSLLNLVKYCYEQDEDIFSEFAPFADWELNAATSQKLYNNQELYSAWHNIYRKHPKEFTAAQDAFAYTEYYKPVYEGLKAKKIDLDKRADVIQGVIFSYAIQHGTGTAVSDIAGAVNNQMTDKEFISAVYAARSSKYPKYVSRYNEEKQAALGLL